jgi:tetratricopeptide (TPR) repeat protein
MIVSFRLYILQNIKPVVKKFQKIIVFLLIAVIPASLSAQNAKQFYKTGMTFIKSGNYKDAIEHLTNALNINPAYVPAYIERSRAYEAIGNLQDAVEDMNRALVFEQSKFELYEDAARLNFTLGNFSTAQELVNKSIKLNRKSELSYRLLTRIQLEVEDYSNALVSVNRALSLKDNPENNFWHGRVSENMKNYNQAEADYENAILKNNQYTEAYLALANVRLATHKHDAAMETCNTLLNIEPGNNDALLLRSRIYARLDEYTKAIDDISKVLAANTENKEMYVTRGNYYLGFTQYQNAINDFSKALLIDNTYAEAMYRRASAYEQFGDFRSAIKDYEMLTTLSDNDLSAQQHLSDARKRLFELNRESDAPGIYITDPIAYGDSAFKIPGNIDKITIRGRISDASDISAVIINKKPAVCFKSGDHYEFTAETDIGATDLITVEAGDVYHNVSTVSYLISRTETDPPVVSIIAPYASDNGEIYLDTDNADLYIEGSISDESTIKTILIDGVAASYTLNNLNPRFSATINVANKNKFSVTAVDNYGNDTTVAFALNREGVSLLEANPMGRTWVVFVENCNYETFPSLDGPAKDVTLMRSALARYDIQKIIHKQDMTKKEMERFFSIELRDLLRSNKVNSLLIWFAGHGKFINETGYWIPVDAKRDDEFTFYNLNAFRASLQSYTNYLTHNLVITDACEAGPTFYQAMRETSKERNCNNWEDVRLKSAQVFSSAGYDLAVDNSQFTKTFANTLANNPDACLPVELIVDKVSVAVSQNNRQNPKFGKIAGLQDEDGTFFFMSK